MRPLVLTYYAPGSQIPYTWETPWSSHSPDFVRHCAALIEGFAWRLGVSTLAIRFEVTAP